VGAQVRPDDLVDRIVDLESRLKIMETTSRLQSSSIRDGLLSIGDASGVTRAEIGKFADGHYGIRTVLPDGTELFRSDERGIIVPPLAVTMTTLTGGTVPDAANTTNASFEVLYVGEVPSFVHQGLRLRIGYGSDAATTGEMEVIIHQFGGADLATSAVLSIGAAANTSATLSWLHGINLPGPRCFVQIAARRTGGAGNVRVTRPYGCYFVGPDGMTGSGGAWTA
jgi:hypothetical protein